MAHPAHHKYGSGPVDTSVNYLQYHDSMEMKAKKQFVKSMIDLCKKFGFDVTEVSDKATSADLAQAASRLKDVVENKLINLLQPGADRKIIVQIAEALNESLRVKIFNTSQDPDALCNSILQYLGSLVRGIHIEFATIRRNVKQAFENCEALQYVMETNVDRTNEILTKFEKQYPQDVKLLREFMHYYEVARMEFKRYFNILRNFMQIESPYPEDVLVSALMPGSQNAEIVQALGVDLTKFRKHGVKGAQAVLGFLGISAAAMQVAEINKYLADLNMSVSDLNLDKNSFLDKASKHITELISTRDPSTLKDADEYFRGSNIEDLRNAITATGGDPVRRSFMNELFDVKGRPNFDDNGNLRSNVEKDLDDLGKQETAIISIFTRELQNKYQDIVKAISELHDKMGEMSQIGEVANNVRDNLLNWIEDDTGSAEIALSGLRNTVNAQQKRENYLRHIDYVIRSTEGYNEFSNLHKALKALREFSDSFYDVNSKRVIYGDADLNAAKPSLARSALSLKEAVNKFAYFFYILTMRNSMTINASQLEKLDDDYVKLVGVSVANEIAELEKYHADLKKTNDEEIAKTGTTEDKKDLAIDTDNSAKVLSVIKKFYKAVQSIDIYLKDFTVYTMKNPTHVNTLKTMIKEMDLVIDWYSEDTGNNLCKVFDNGMYVDTTGDDVTKDKDGNLVPQKSPLNGWDGKTHYYEVIANANILPTDKPTEFRASNKFVQTDSSNTMYDEKITDIKNTVDNFIALKNLINMFTKIGYTNKSNFMTPNEVYVALSDFIKLCSHHLKHDNNKRHIYITSLDNVGKHHRYFVATIQAIVGKILTVVGLCDINKDITPDTIIQDTRFILGGSQIVPIPEASELYFRLPRLLKLYASIFNISDKKVDNDSKRFYLIPDVGSKFTPLIKLVMIEKSDNVSLIVSEINKIYEEYKDKSNVCKEVVKDLVAEINAKFGLIKYETITKYQSAIKLSDRPDDTTSSPSINYKIFDDEEVAKDILAPSDLYSLSKGSSITPNDTETKIIDLNEDDAVFSVYNDFTSKIYKYIKEFSKNNVNVSFNKFINEHKQQMEKATDDKKISIAHMLISDSDTRSVNNFVVATLEEVIMTGYQTILTLVDILDKIFKSDPIFIKYIAISKGLIHLLDDGKKVDSSRLGETILHFIKQWKNFAELLTFKNRSRTVDKMIEQVNIVEEKVRNMYDHRHEDYIDKKVNDHIKDNQPNIDQFVLNGTGTESYTFIGSPAFKTLSLSGDKVVTTPIDITIPLKGSLIHVFNFVVAELLDKLVDTSTSTYSKFYIGIIQDFYDIVSGLPDNNTSIDKSNLIHGNIIKSLKTIMSQLNTSGTINVNLYRSLTDVPGFVKDKYKVYLPVFSNILDNLLQLVSTYKIYGKLGAELNRIDRMILVLYNSCQRVLGELSATYKYCEVSNDSIEQYKSRYGELPIMSYTFYTSFINQLTSEGGNLNYRSIVPVHGTVAYDMMYGFNYVIKNTNLELSNLPYVEQTIKNYNSNNKASISESEYSKYLSTMNRLNLFAFNVCSINAIESPDDLLIDLDEYYSIITNKQNTYYKDTYKKYIFTDIDTSIESEIDADCIQNIIDLNVIPINIHMMMRSIPLVNVMNYSNVMKKYSNHFLNTREFNYTANVFCELMSDPYSKLQSTDLNDTSSVDEKMVSFSMLSIGDDSLGTGRPKFISDQLYGKVFLQSEYPYFSKDHHSIQSVRFGQYLTPLGITDEKGKWLTQTTGLTYIDSSNKLHPVVKLGTMHYEDFLKVFKFRLNTILVRNLIFITNCHRFLRIVLEREFTESRKVVESDLMGLHKLTEFGLDPMLSNERLSSNYPNGLDRYYSKGSYLKLKEKVSAEDMEKLISKFKSITGTPPPTKKEIDEMEMKLQEVSKEIDTIQKGINEIKSAIQNIRDTTPIKKVEKLLKYDADLNKFATELKLKNAKKDLLEHQINRAKRILNELNKKPPSKTLYHDTEDVAAVSTDTEDVIVDAIDKLNENTGDDTHKDDSEIIDTVEEVKADIDKKVKETPITVEDKKKVTIETAKKNVEELGQRVNKALKDISDKTKIDSISIIDNAKFITTTIETIMTECLNIATPMRDDTELKTEFEHVVRLMDSITLNLNMYKDELKKEEAAVIKKIQDIVVQDYANHDKTKIINTYKTSNTTNTPDPPRRSTWTPAQQTVITNIYNNKLFLQNIKSAINNLPNYYALK